MVAESPSAEQQVVELETVSRWDGESYVSALEASNGVTKCRGIVFSPANKCVVNSFSFHLRLKRGNGVAFLPIVGAWHAGSTRVTDILYRGDMQEITEPTFTEYTCKLPAGLPAGPEQHLALGFYTEECTSHRSSGADIAQIPELIEAPTIPHSLEILSTYSLSPLLAQYLNGKFATGTWRTYQGTLACRVTYTLLPE